MTHDEIIAAAALFERRDACAAQLREIDAELAYMHGAYMRAERLWGLRLEGFRCAIGAAHTRG
jgi:hypothetical protein